MWNLRNKLNQQAQQRQTHREQDDSQGWREGRWGALSQKEKGLMDMDNSVVIVWEGWYKGLNGNGKIQKSNN